MYTPCFECWNRYGNQYTVECDDKCDYAKIAKENKELINSALIFPQTIGNMTFYSKAELFEWVENIQEKLYSPSTGLSIGCETYKEKLTKEDFFKQHCCMCGSQRCKGIDTEWFDGCEYRYELNGYSEG